MNRQERDGLRHKHRNIDGRCADCVQEYLGWPEYPECEPADYPCDTIKVLDAWEADLGNIEEFAEGIVTELLETYTDKVICKHLSKGEKL
jgi:hypothetical protein